MLLEKLQQYTPILLEASITTVLLAVVGIILAGIMAFVAGLANLSQFWILRAASRIYIEFFRGTSELVQLYWFAFAVPLIFGFRIAPLAVAAIVLGLNLGSYGAEVVRGSVLAVPREQFEGATALSFSSTQRMRRVILPQAVAGMIPPFNNLAIQLLKSTSLVSLIGVTDLMGEVSQLRNSTGDTIVLFAMTLVIYFILAYIITLLMRGLERRVGARLGRRPAKRQGLIATEATVHE